MTRYAPLILTAISGAALSIAFHTIPVRHRKVGGIRFVRIGRLQLSFCVCRCSI